MLQKNKPVNRIIEMRKNKNWSQSQPADKVGMSYTQIRYYETKGAQPPVEGLKKIADAIDSSVNFLINGITEDKTNACLNDAEVIQYLKKMDALAAKDKSVLNRDIAGFIRDTKTKSAFNS